MLKPYLWRPSLTAWGASSLLAMTLILAACGGGTVPAVEEGKTEASATAAQVENEPTEEAEAIAQNTPTTEKVEATAAVATEETAGQQAPQTASGPATCEPLEIPVNDLISPVSAEDWVKGPETAAVTLIELGDFQ